MFGEHREVYRQIKSLVSVGTQTQPGRFCFGKAWRLNRQAVDARFQQRELVDAVVRSGVVENQIACLVGQAHGGSGHYGAIWIGDDPGEACALFARWNHLRNGKVPPWLLRTRSQARLPPPPPTAHARREYSPADAADPPTAAVRPLAPSVGNS